MGASTLRNDVVVTVRFARGARARLRTLGASWGFHSMGQRKGSLGAAILSDFGV